MQLGLASTKKEIGKLTIGDNLIILGKTTGIIKTKIESMEIENKPIKEIAQVMGRQPSAIRARLLRLGIVK